ncbi:hypothetical protein D3C87_1487290 [compost metagenome]
MPSVAALSLSDNNEFRIQTLLESDQRRSWLKKGKLITDSADVVFLENEGDIKKSFPTAVSLTRKINGKEQRIVVTGDADFMSNTELKRTVPAVGNFVFSTGVFSWLSYGEFPIARYRPKVRDTVLLVSKDQVKVIRFIFVWVIPGILLATGAILLIRRKRK